MKFSNILISALVVGATPAWAASAVTFTAFGAANVICGDPYPEAKAQSLRDANENCQFLGAKTAKVVSERELGSFRGSCWAGRHSGVALEIRYECE